MEIGKAIAHMFPNAVYRKDYEVIDEGEGAYIAVWNMDVPQPSEEEMQAVLDELKANPPVEPLSPYEELKKQQADLVFELLMKGVL